MGEISSFSVPTAQTPAAAPAAPPTPAPASGPAPAAGAPADRPAWLPEKFQSAEALATAYTELERKLSAGQPGAADKDVPSPAGGSPRLSAEALQPFFEAYRSGGGKLTDEHYTQLAGMGADRSLVDAYIAGQEAQAAGNAQRVYAAVGGEANYQAMLIAASKAVAEGKLPAAQIAAYNRLTETGDVDTIAIAARGLAAAVGIGAAPAPAPAPTPTTQVAGNRGGGVVGFGSFKEFVLAVKDPRYAKDPGYRAEVDRRLSASSGI